MTKSMNRRVIILCFVCFFAVLSFWKTGIGAEKKNGPEEFAFHIFLTEKNCQIAIWLIDAQGDFVDTVYVTRKVAEGGLGNR